MDEPQIKAAGHAAPRRAGVFASSARLAGRYLIAGLMIPVGVALGVGGLVQHALRRRQRPRSPGERPGS